jgi:hypothetical protein
MHFTATADEEGWGPTYGGPTKTGEGANSLMGLVKAHILVNPHSVVTDPTSMIRISWLKS